MADLKLVYLATGRRAHQIRKDGVSCVRCGTRPRPWEQWYGTESQVQRKIARIMPLCQKTIGSKGDSQ